MSETINVSLNTDGDGFLSQECPGCERRFKVKFGEGGEGPISFCPYCDYTGQNCWWTPEQAKHLGEVASQQVVGPMLDKVAKNLKRNAGGLLSVSVNRQPPRMPNPPAEHDHGWPVFLFDCCNEPIKHDEQNTSLFCILCGVEASVDLS